MTEDVKKDKTLTRRQFLGFLAGMSCITGLGGFYLRCITPYTPEITRVTLGINDLPPALEGLTFVHISDVHHSPIVSIEYLEKCVAMINSLRADLVLITGDFISSSIRYGEPCAAVLGKLASRLGIFAVPGNHDNWLGCDELARSLNERGIRMLVNEHVPVAVGGELLYIIGLDDLWTGWPRMEKASRGIPGNARKIVLMHNPDLFEHYSGGHYDIILAGHTHGGQVHLPGIGPLIVPSRFGRKYAQGLFSLNGSTMYVSRGLGLARPAVRFMCPPEITLFTMTSKQG